MVSIAGYPFPHVINLKLIKPDLTLPKDVENMFNFKENSK